MNAILAGRGIGVSVLRGALRKTESWNCEDEDKMSSADLPAQSYAGKAASVIQNRPSRVRQLVVAESSTTAIQGTSVRRPLPTERVR